MFKVRTIVDLLISYFTADYGLNDSPYSVWGEELKASQGLELAGNSPEYGKERKTMSLYINVFEHTLKNLKGLILLYLEHVQMNNPYFIV